MGPPDYVDGLLENKPAIVNDTDYFSLSLLGDKYDANNDWSLLMDLIEDDRILVTCLLYTSPSPRDRQKSRMPSSA